MLCRCDDASCALLTGEVIRDLCFKEPLHFLCRIVIYAKGCVLIAFRVMIV